MAATRVRDAVPFVLGFVLTTAALFGPGLLPPRGPVSDPSSAVAPASLTCRSALPVQGIVGAFSIDGGPEPLSAADGAVLTISYSVGYRTFVLGNSSTVPLQCRGLTGNVTTSPNGTFSFDPTVPASHCAETSGVVVCTQYAPLPSGPLTFRLAGGLPPEYQLESGGGPRSYAVALVYPWQSLALTPSAPVVTTSVGEPTTVTATVLAGNGSATGLPTSFRWSVNGTGWSWGSSRTGPSVELTPVPGAGIAVVQVVATTSINASVFLPLAATVQLNAVATEIETASLNRTAVDAGDSVAVSLAATGASGLNYTAWVDPGLGVEPVPLTCSTPLPSGNGVDLSCAATVVYPSAGTAQPTATVSNGYSSTSWRFPAVTVTPAPELAVVDGPPVGYVGAPIAVTVEAANGTGARPFVSACLADGAAPPVCLSQGGPSWTFEPSYPAAGNYSATAWAHDAGGTNTSISFRVAVVPDLTIGPIVMGSANASVGAAARLSATVAGGVLPLRFWWNASAAGTPVGSGELTTDGPAGATLLPTTSGPLLVTLTVVDARGTRAVQQLLLEVAPATAVRVAALAVPPAGSSVAGAPVALSWAAFLATGTVARAFSQAAVLNLTDPEGVPDAWVNASGVGPLTAIAPGEFLVPATAWIGGVLNLSVAVATSTQVTVQLGGDGLPSTVAPIGLDVLPDRGHVHLFDPKVGRAGTRSNATLWQVEDPYGNAAPGALLSIELAFGGTRSTVVVAALSAGPDRSSVWINYSAPTLGAGTVSVLNAAGAVVVGPIAVPAAPPAPGLQPAVTTTATVAPFGAAGLVAVVLARRRRRRRDPEAGEGELRALAEGRARTVALIGEAGAIDLAGLEAAWRPPPAPPALADWLASLVADGTLRATLGNDGRARFCLADAPSGGPRVTVDAAALEASLRRRDDEFGAPDGPPR